MWGAAIALIIGYSAYWYVAEETEDFISKAGW